MRSLDHRLPMRDPGGKSLGNRLFIGETALGPLSLKLPVQIGGQPHGCFDRSAGAHTTRSPNFGIVLKKAIAGRRVNRVHPAGQPPTFRGHLCSSIRTDWNTIFRSFIRWPSQLQELCSEFRTNRRLNLACSRSAMACGKARSRRTLPGEPRSVGGIRHHLRRRVQCFVKRYKFNKIRQYLYNKSGEFAVLLLANHVYLLYKV